MIEIIPTILTNDSLELKRKLSLAEGVVERVQIDIIDGQFADNKTIDPSLLEDVETSLKLDYHLMTKEPINWLEKCIRGSAERIIGQVEMMASQAEFIGRVQEAGLQVGLGLDLKTEVSEIDKSVINDLDVVLVMSVKAGFGGQKFEPEVLDKFKILEEIRARDKTPFKIGDDGGITMDYIDDLRVAGVDEAIIGERLFKGDLKDNIDQYLKAAYK